MSKTPSSMVPLGTKAPYFSLPDAVSGQSYTFNDRSKYPVTVVFFICNHCPYVHHINPSLVKLTNEYQAKGVSFIAINANDVSKYPEDSPAQMKITAQKEQYSFPYLFDETQEIAKAYKAACTPDFFVYNEEHTLVYRGQFDDSRPGSAVPVSGSSLKYALDCVLNKTPLDAAQHPSIGCNIKWKD